MLNVSGYVILWYRTDNAKNNITIFLQKQNNFCSKKMPMTSK